MKTERMTIDPNHIDGERMRRAAEVLRRGGLVAFPTETVYGLGANAFDRDAAEKIYAAKGRPPDNPLIVHIADPAEFERLCVPDDPALLRRLVRAFCPGPLTVINPKNDRIPSAVTAGLDTVAIRCPRHPVARELIRRAGVPVAAPSANLSGKPSPTAASHVQSDLDGRIDLILDGGDCEFGLESTVVRMKDGGLQLLRPGGITVEMLRQVCGELTVDPAVFGALPPGRAPLSPGMKYRHYAPAAPLCAVRGEEEAVLRFFAERLREEDCGVLCFDEDLPVLREGARGTVLSLGKRADGETQARRLFGCLRALDEGRLRVLYTRLPPPDHLGLAVVNRLLKACGYTVIEL